MLSRLKIMLQYLLPKQLMSEFAGWVANKKLGIVTTWMIKAFIKFYHVNMHEAKNPKPEYYATFNAFFTRKLSSQARSIHKSPSTLIMAADGIVSQFGSIKSGKMIQAKGHDYSLDALLACNSSLIDRFIKGYYLTIYLSPRDYHRVHMPCAGTLREMIYVPGSLFSVSLLTASKIPNIFARNERVICYFETEFGPMIQILIGATIVGSIETPWHGLVTPPREGIAKRWVYENIHLEQGDEMGCFRLGSTVITLFGEQAMAFDSHLRVGMTARLGKVLGQRI